MNSSEFKDENSFLNYKVNAVVREIVIVKELRLEPVVNRPREKMMASPLNNAGKEMQRHCRRRPPRNQVSS